ncbi:MAG: HAD family phosphatase [Chloroflexi bacterium CFX7]|nr:HAD family phosphatase [Chloroflexi bacterium CFX7]
MSAWATARLWNRRRSRPSSCLSLPRSATGRAGLSASPWAANAPAGLVPVTHLREADLTGLLTVLAHVDEGDPHLAELAPWAGRVRVHNAVAFDGSGMITVTAAGIDKGTALVALCGALGLDPEEAVAFGDSEVDIPMFEAAGLAVAMGNATAPVRAAAAMVTATADEGGVAQAIHRIWGC